MSARPENALLKGASRARHPGTRRGQGISRWLGEKFEAIAGVVGNVNRVASSKPNGAMLAQPPWRSGRVTDEEAPMEAAQVAEHPGSHLSAEVEHGMKA